MKPDLFNELNLSLEEALEHMRGGREAKPWEHTCTDACPTFCKALNQSKSQYKRLVIQGAPDPERRRD